MNIWLRVGGTGACPGDKTDSGDSFGSDPANAKAQAGHAEYQSACVALSQHIAFFLLPSTQNLLLALYPFILKRLSGFYSLGTCLKDTGR